MNKEPSAMTQKMKSFEWYRGNLAWLKNHTIFLTAGGSHAYGTNLPTSDMDFRGIAIPPKEYFLGNLHKFEQAEVKGDPDVVIMEIRKFFKLAADCNPNIIELLYADPSDWVLWNSWWDSVIAHRDLFLSQKAKHTFSGYGMSQLNKIKSHRRWLFDHPDHVPTRKEFGLPEGRGTVSKEQLDIINSRIRKISDNLAGAFGTTAAQLETPEAEEELIKQAFLQLELSESLMPVVYAERRFRAACETWDSYQTWLAERNAKRSELEKKYGYDTKFGMHLVRLMRMGEEILTKGIVHVKRPDAEELIDIRNGAWSFEKLDEWANEMDQKLHTLESKLPHGPDRTKIDQVLVDVVDIFLKTRSKQ